MYIRQTGFLRFYVYTHMIACSVAEFAAGEDNAEGSGAGLLLDVPNLLKVMCRSYYCVETPPQSVWDSDTQVAASMTVRF